MKQAIIVGLVLVAAAAAAVMVVTNLPPRPDGADANGLAGGSGGTIPTGDWPIYRGSPAMLGVADGGLPDAMQLKWRFRTTEPVSSSAVIAGGRVYFGSDDSHVYCLDAATGERVWRFSAEDIVQAPPVHLDGRIYVGSDDSFLYCLDAVTGKRIWKHETQVH